jgi:phospholipid/cholesterol/gamma-HCH transport system permease protein
LLTHFSDLVLSEVKSALFGLSTGLVACYRGLTTGGGPKGVGDSVNQTVVLAVVLLGIINVLMTAVYLQLGNQV